MMNQMEKKEKLELGNEESIQGPRELTRHKPFSIQILTRLDPKTLETLQQ
jgi:hypothetical protein